jgi:hypothetical protein
MNPFPSDFSSGQIFIQFIKLYVSFGIKTYNPQIPGLAPYQWDQIKYDQSHPVDRLEGYKLMH